MKIIIISIVAVWFHQPSTDIATIFSTLLFFPTLSSSTVSWNVVKCMAFHSFIPSLETVLCIESKDFNKHSVSCLSFSIPLLPVSLFTCFYSLLSFHFWHHFVDSTDLSMCFRECLGGCIDACMHILLSFLKVFHSFVSPSQSNICSCACVCVLQ